MDIKHHTHPDRLETYSFWWSEVRILLAAIALFLGGVPAVFYLLPYSYGVTWPLLKLCWIVSGIVSAYLAYRWYAGGQKVFGGKKTYDLVAFGISVISGLNLGLAGILDANIGMRILSGKWIFLVVGVIYLIAGFYLWKRYGESDKKLF